MRSKQLRGSGPNWVEVIRHSWQFIILTIALFLDTFQNLGIREYDYDRMSKLTKEQAIAFRKRWQMVNDAEIEELRNTSPAEKLRQTATLMASAQALGWSDSSNTDETSVWERWQQLRKKYCG